MTAAILGFMFDGDIKSNLKETMSESMSVYYENDGVRIAWDEAQQSVSMRGHESILYREPIRHLESLHPTTLFVIFPLVIFSAPTCALVQT